MEETRVEVIEPREDEGSDCEILIRGLADLHIATVVPENMPLPLCHRPSSLLRDLKSAQEYVLAEREGDEDEERSDKETLEEETNEGQVHHSITQADRELYFQAMNTWNQGMLVNDYAMLYGLEVVCNDWKSTAFLLPQFVSEICMYTGEEKNQVVLNSIAKKISEVEEDGETKLEHIIIPVCDNIHWCLVSIDFKQQYFVHYDSIPGRCSTSDLVIRALRSAFKKAEYHEGVNPRLFELLEGGRWKKRTVPVPRQDNDIDCGVFVVHFAECIASNADEDVLFDIEPANVNNYRREFHQRIAHIGPQPLLSRFCN